MASVRIVITSRTLGDISVDQDPEIGYLEPGRERAQVRQLLANALAQVERALELERLSEPLD